MCFLCYKRASLIQQYFVCFAGIGHEKIRQCRSLVCILRHIRTQLNKDKEVKEKKTLNLKDVQSKVFLLV